jgi:predicted nicotinamide N-methyase
MIRKSAASRVLSNIRAYSDMGARVMRETETVVLGHCAYLRLRLITPACLLYDAPMNPSSFPFHSLPYWGFLWPGGYGIAHYLASIDIMPYTHVLDVGSGCGVCGLAAAFSRRSSFGTSATSQDGQYSKGLTVIFNDVDAEALAASQLNWQLNSDACHKNGFASERQLTPPILCSDDLLQIQDEEGLLTHLSRICGSAENLISLSSWLITAGDIAYDDNMADQMLALLHRCRRLGAAVLIGDPGRVAFQRAAEEHSQLRFRRIHSTPIRPPVFHDDDSHSTASVMRLE